MTWVASQYSFYVDRQSNIHTLIGYTFLTALTVSALHYVITLRQYKRIQTVDSRKKPPLVPHFVPVLGSIPWRFFWDPIQFFTSGYACGLSTVIICDDVLIGISYIASLRHPVRIKLLGRSFYIVQGPENVLAHLAQTTTSNTIFNSTFLRQACDMSAKAVQRLESESEEPPKYFERKTYLTASPLNAWNSSVIHRYLAGRSAVQLSRRFESNLKDRMHAHRALTVPNGIIMDDFLDFFVEDVTGSLVDSLCGKGLLKRHPDFLPAFWTFCDNLPTYMKGTPKFLAPQAYKAKQKVVEAVRDWQLWASEHFDPTSTPLNEDGDDPFWGSKFFRERFSIFVYDMGFEPKDISSMELGFLLG